jgi:sugar lactone lactonase YvrE
MTLHHTPLTAGLTGRPSALGWGRDQLGESGVWWPERDQLWWTDIRRPAVRVADVGTRELRTFEMPELCGGLCLTDEDDLVVALETRLCRLDPATGDLTTVAVADRWSPGMRFNEVKCDPSGRLWAGYMNDRTREPVGWLFRVEHGTFVPVLDGVAVPNSLAWSPDGSAMFFSDGVQPAVDRFDFDPATSTCEGRRRFLRLPDGGVPDGMAADAEGHYWCAHYGGSRIIRLTPDGSVERVVRLPVSQPTNCTFGGPDLDVLFVTTARQRLTQDQLLAQAEAGEVFALRVDVPGAAVPRVGTAALVAAGTERAGG